MDEEQFKQITTELAYLRKEIEELKNQKPVEMHYHYTFDYSQLPIKLIDINEDPLD